MSKDNNKFPGENNTGHFWDDEGDIRELKNRPPRWYMYSLYIGVVAILIYSFMYPSIPWFGESSRGYLNWTQIEEMKDNVEVLEKFRTKRFAGIEKEIASASLADILNNDNLKLYSIKTAKTLFGDNCAACHGAGGQGNDGFPVLADDDWLYGGTLSQISQSITHGRKGSMPARMMGISDKDSDLLAQYIYELGLGDKGTTIPSSKKLYTTKGCIGCHGADMKGNIYMGSANLTDSIYRFKAHNQKESILRTILHGVNQNNDTKTQNAEMPAFGNSPVISATQIKKLTIYVHELGGGK